MMKNALIFLLMIVLGYGAVWGQDGDQASAPTNKEIVEFKLSEGESLNLEELKQINNSPNDIDQPGFVTIDINILKGEVVSCAWYPYFVHAGTTAFFEKVESVLKTWKFTSIPDATGDIYFTVATNGTIRINLRRFNLGDYNKYRFASPDLLVKVKGFEKQNIRAMMEKGQEPGKKEQSTLEKLGTPYVIAFSILALIFLGAAVLTILNLKKNVDFKPKTLEQIKSLWINNGLKLKTQLKGADGQLTIETERSIDDENPDLDEETLFVKSLASALEDGTIEKQDQEEVGEFTKIIDYKKLGQTLLSIIKGAKSDVEKQEAISKCKSIVWNDYSVKYIQKAKDLCRENTNLRISRIFLAGLENHLNNKDAWYASSEIDRAVDKTAASELEQMNGYLDWVWVVASVAPMVGLFGTVTGISQAFARISESSAGMAQGELISNLAGGINVALYTTIYGLIIGMSATLVYYFIKSFLDGKSSEWEKLFVEITNNF